MRRPRLHPPARPPSYRERVTDAAEEPQVPAGPEPIPLLVPREGVPDPVVTAERLHDVEAAFAGGTGPVAMDAERASGYRYGQRAYLVQLRRAGSGTALVDPIPFGDLSSLGAAIVDAEWVLHAANQDLPCLAELGMRPERIFDTELAGRLLGSPRVGLGPLVEEVLGYSLEKGHSAVDWSTRPLPEPWLRYAALDVEVLIELRDALEERLREQGKLGWAHEEFAAVLAAGTPLPRTDPWRRTSGLHRIRRRRALAVVRELWETRDRIARERDLSPGRVLPDAAIIAAALDPPGSLRDLTSLPMYGARQARRYAGDWFEAVERARSLPDEALPNTTLPHDGPPPARRLGRTRPTRGRTAGPGTSSGGSDRRRARFADREPARPRCRTPTGLGSTGSARSGGRGRNPARTRGPRVAGGAHCGAADARDRAGRNNTRMTGPSPRQSIITERLVLERVTLSQARAIVDGNLRPAARRRVAARGHARRTGGLRAGGYERRRRRLAHSG